MNGWLLSIGPHLGSNANHDKHTAKTLNCRYATYGENGGRWMCQHCKAHIRSHQIASANGNWYHEPCASQLQIPWRNDPLITHIVYNYHAINCGRADVIDDINKLAASGPTVVIDAHDIYGLENINKSLKVVCHNNQTKTKIIKLGFNDITIIPYMTPILDVNSRRQRHLRLPGTTHCVGWCGSWAPVKQVHLLIEAIAKLRAAGTNVGLVIIGQIRVLGNTELISSRTYYEYCLDVCSDLKLNNYTSVHNSDYMADTILSKCDMICLPTRQHHGSSRSAIACFKYSKPVIVPRHEPFSDVLNSAYVIDSNVTADSVAEAIAHLLSNNAVYQGCVDGAKYLTYYHQPHEIAKSYLDFLVK